MQFILWLRSICTHKETVTIFFAELSLDASSLMLEIFEQGFRYFEMGYASALAWILLIITLLITLIQFKLSKRWVHYEN